MSGLTIEDLLQQAESHAPKPRNEDGDGDSNRIEVIHMNARTHQGAINFIPFTGLDGKTVDFLYDIKEMQVPSGENNENWRWGKACSPETYPDATPEQIERVKKVRSMIMTAIDEEIFSDEDARNRNYCLVAGYVLSHQNTENEIKSNKDSRKLALLVFPSKNFASAVATMIRNIAAMSGQAGIDALYNRNLERNCYIECSFKLGGNGYDVQLACKTFDMFAGALMHENEKPKQMITIPEDAIKDFTSPTSYFLTKSEKYYNQEYMDNMYNFVLAELDKEGAAADLGTNVNAQLENNNKPSDWKEPEAKTGQQSDTPPAPNA